MIKHFTATVYILYQNKVLLHFHKKIKKWLPPGGHIEANETPSEAAIREAKEETGLDIIICKDEHFWIESPNSKSIERPYLSLLEEIPAYGSEPYHQHIDMIYLGRPATDPLETPLENGFRWFSLSDLDEIKNELFLDTKTVLEKIL